MSVQSEIFAKLSDPSSATAALLGAGVGCRLFPELAPNGTEVPYAVFNHIATEPATTHNEAFGIANRLIQFSCYARTFAQAVAIRDAITADLDNVELDGGDIPILQDQRNGFEEAVDLFRADCDFLV